MLKICPCEGVFQALRLDLFFQIIWINVASICCLESYPSISPYIGIPLMSQLARMMKLRSLHLLQIEGLRVTAVVEDVVQAVKFDV